MNNKTRPYQGVYPTLGNNVYIDESSVILGDITLGDDVSIWPLVAARGDVNHMTIGARSNVQDGCVLHVTRRSTGTPDGYSLSIGEDVTVGHKCVLHGCTLKNRILVGMGAVVMDNVTVNDDVIIGAGSLVPPNKTLEAGHLYVGHPVRRIRKLKEEELQFLKESAANYVRLKDEYLDQV
ncbi:MAG: gamma carbonic anhydrase family protein [Algicola sp.]|nr:gamma carbonic anhydrase family protein [Algicola sp.]